MVEHDYEQHDVFISYCYADHEWVRGELLPGLEAAGLKVVVDYRDFEIGVSKLTNIERAVDMCHYTLVVLTPAWIESEWAEFESLLAETADPAGRRHKLMPLLYAPCQLPRRIAALTAADFTNPDTRDAQMERLLRGLGAKPARARIEAHRRAS
jgi:TIR domain